jgi:hypothetical protein
MMLMVDHSPAPSTIHAEDRFARMVEDLSTSQGDDGRRVAEGLRNVLVHWFDRAQCLVDTPASEALEFQAVQLRSAGTMRVRYRPGGRLRVAPYEFDDE